MSIGFYQFLFQKLPGQADIFITKSKTVMRTRRGNVALKATTGKLQHPFYVIRAKKL